MPSTVTPNRTIGQGDSTDTVAALATGAIGGTVGRHGTWPRGIRHAVTAAGLSLVSCLTLLLGFLQKSYCVRHGWGAPDVYWKACYSDLPSVVLRDAMRGIPYSPGHPLSEPLGTGLALRAVAAFAPADGLERQQVFFVAWAVLSALLTVLLVAATVWTCRRHPDRAAHVAFSPLLLTVALVSGDLVGVVLTSLALWAWSRHRPATAGVLFGVAAVTRTYPILIVLVLGILALRSDTLRVWARTAGAALLTAVAALGAGTLLLGPGVFGPYQTWAAGGAQLGSPWYLATLAEKPIQMGPLTLLAVLGWVLAVGVAALLALSAPVRPRVAEIAIVMLVIVLLTGKALPVQSSLWLVPLVALAGLPWRDHLIWAAGEVLSFVAVWLYLGGIGHENAALPVAWYGVFLVLRLAGLAWLATAAARQAWGRRPHPGVEADDVAGPMTGRPDAMVVRYDR